MSNFRTFDDYIKFIDYMKYNNALPPSFPTEPDMFNDEIAGQDSPEQTSPFDHSTSFVFDRLERLQNVTDLLSKRLDPILKPDTPSPKDPSDKPMSESREGISPSTIRVFEIGDNINKIVERINSLIRRLDI